MGIRKQLIIWGFVTVAVVGYSRYINRVRQFQRLSQATQKDVNHQVARLQNQEAIAEGVIEDVSHRPLVDAPPVGGKVSFRAVDSMVSIPFGKSCRVQLWAAQGVYQNAWADLAVFLFPNPLDPLPAQQAVAQLGLEPVGDVVVITWDLPGMGRPRSANVGDFEVDGSLYPPRDPQEGVACALAAQKWAQNWLRGGYSWMVWAEELAAPVAVNTLLEWKRNDPIFYRKNLGVTLQAPIFCPSVREWLKRESPAEAVLLETDARDNPPPKVSQELWAPFGTPRRGPDALRRSLHWDYLKRLDGWGDLRKQIEKVNENAAQKDGVLISLEGVVNLKKRVTSVLEKKLTQADAPKSAVSHLIEPFSVPFEVVLPLSQAQGGLKGQTKSCFEKAYGL